MQVDLNLVEWNSRESFLLQHSVDQVVLHPKMRKEGLAIIKRLLTGKAPERRFSTRETFQGARTYILSLYM